ncbi:plasmid pRiA4b ORF-3 family protein [Paenisporosarcina cavernae]|uniref:Plasmid pRiA4b ORF-3 family protein n=1 Tax=Paenisporosarcina cavernae TaxID=2320858 RepID=A0A385YVU2_9BACL|nr:plasmid pRiA4b ORF-3 family protein [Paenisporosarcina cavernae]AYC30654.1 plasmid pRiA4b ORF-3 family protein [Paenisporosarcina cavernae]
MRGYQFLVKLQHVQPEVWRRIVLPEELDFYDLHSVIQRAMGWKDVHLFSFFLENEDTNTTIRLDRDEDSVEEHQAMAAHFKKNVPEKDTYAYSRYEDFIRTNVLLAREVPLSEYVSTIPTFGYTYDFGDGWDHTVQLEAIVEDFNKDFPLVMEGEGDCPPEDVGGPPGYAHFLQVLANPQDDEHDTMKAWATSQGFKSFSVKDANDALEEEWC